MMNKKILLPLIGGTLLAIVVVFFSLSKSSKNQNIRSPVSENNLITTTSIIPKAKLTEYKDPSGFKFSYPENLKLQNKEIENQKIYSLLELTFLKDQGKIEIRVEDSQLTKIDDWFTNNKEATKPANIKKIKLADIEGRQFTQKDKFLTIALDQGALFTFTVTLGKEGKYWLDANNQILKSFQFILPENTENNVPVGDESSEEDVIFEGEEIIE